MNIFLFVLGHFIQMIAVFMAYSDTIPFIERFFFKKISQIEQALKELGRIPEGFCNISRYRRPVRGNGYLNQNDEKFGTVQKPPNLGNNR